MNPHVFREYDVRGVVDRDLNEDFIVDLGRAIGTYAAQNNVQIMTVGRDCRLSSADYRQYLIRGLNAAGIDTIDIGLCATPMLYFAIRHCGAGGGVMITGSHNPPEFNGFKICIGYDSIYGAQIQELRKIMEAEAYRSGSGKTQFRDIAGAYSDFLFKNVKITRKLNVVMDAGNGVGGKFALPLLEKLGCTVTCIYCDPDGRFPHHFPDPTVEDNLQILIRTVAETKADLGIAFDGDADRLGVISNTGEIIWGDKLLLLFARYILKESPGATVIGEVKCSQVLYDGIRQAGGRPIMWKAGHSLIKAKMKEENALLGGEMSGHLFFADRYFGYDDAIYAALRLLEILSQTNSSVSELLADTPKTFATPEIRVDCPDDKKCAVVEKIKERYRSTPGMIDIDGVRVPFPDGWALVRCSNTQPVIVLRFEASSADRLDTIRREVEGLLDV
ncbi:MAG: phosphomannomutase/phosphoglucomutase [Smithellaceae bacterium]|nr:phosphomannomutase/phosphoglucomutase [Syntrophaceae bacterium]MDD4240115.1 phosphomannomutase/phosphoglucomutase [Smithellaceae bacterium]NLX51879.1 phosphomannomutase/phosphoglucomutase [Deltaproteobacteria bacterium]